MIKKHTAVQYINEYTDILGQTILLCPVIYPSTDFTEVRPYVDRVSNITNNVSFVAMIGPEQSLVAEFALIPAMLAEMPSVSGVASSVNLESVSLYDSFYHCIGPEVFFYYYYYFDFLLNFDFFFFFLVFIISFYYFSLFFFIFLLSFSKFILKT